MRSIQYLAIILLLVVTSVANAQVPKLNSYPSARATVFIDFDGQYLTGSSWNWNGPINAQPAGFSSAAVTEIFNRVAEDYRPFDLNITTDSTYYWNAPVDQRVRIIVTPTSQWYGSAGGVSYVGSFTWGDNTPAWVFSALLNNNIKWVAEAISHEAGHTLGLQHQSTYDNNCNKVAEYSGGQGSGEIGWAPIMGVGYYENLTTWNIGPNTYNCSTIQDDINVIVSSNGFGFRSDDHGNSIAAATTVNTTGGSFLVNGLVNQSTDIDVFKVVLTTPNNLSLYATPQNVGNNNAGANIDIKVTLMNNTDTIGSYNPSTLLNAGVDTNLNAGTYYLVVDGVGNMYHSNYGSIGSYSLTGVLGGVLPFRSFVLKGNSDNVSHQLSWSYITDEQISDVQLEVSTDGKNFITLKKVDPSAQSFSYKSPGMPDAYYRVRAIAGPQQQVYYSNTIVLHDKTVSNPVHIADMNYTNEILVSSNGNFNYSLFTASGQLINKGTLTQGSNRVSTNASKGLMLLRYSDGNKSFTEKFIKQ